MKKLFSQILLVDDDTITNYINDNLLEDMQVADQIYAMPDGAQALAFINKHWLAKGDLPAKEQPKLLLLDINMMQMDGFELLERLAGLPPIHNLCIVILTFSHHPRDFDKAERYQVDAFLEKPLTREKLESIAGTLQQCAEKS